MNKKQKRQRNIILMVVVGILLLLIILMNNQFTIFTEESSTTTRFNMKPGTSSFVFDDYKLDITATNKVYSSSGCDDTSNWNEYSYCDYRLDYVDEDGCQIWSAGTTVCSKRYSSGRCYSSDTYCDVSNRRTTQGMEYYTKNYGCFWKGKISYKGQVIETIEGNYRDGYTKTSQRYYFNQNGSKGSSSEHFYYLYWASYGTQGENCIELDGTVKINLNENDFNFKVETFNKNILFVDENKNIIVHLSQNLTEFTGKLIIDYEIDTQIGSASKQEIIDVVINKGDNEYKINIPTKSSTQELKITPSLELYYDVSSWSGIKDSNQALVGTIKFDTETFLINPRLNWLNKTLCGDNCEGCNTYSLSADKTICVNDEVKDLSCAIIGCPVVEGHNIMCMSSGFCSEFIEKFIDRGINESVCNEQCKPLGGVCQLSENQDWYCVAKEIVEVIKELPTPIYIDKTCADFDLCGEGFTCQDFNSTAKCIQDKEQFELTQIPFLYIIILILFIIIIFIYYKNKNKRRR